GEVPAGPLVVLGHCLGCATRTPQAARTEAQAQPHAWQPGPEGHLEECIARLGPATKPAHLDQSVADWHALTLHSCARAVRSVTAPLSAPTAAPKAADRARTAPHGARAPQARA